MLIGAPSCAAVIAWIWAPALPVRRKPSSLTLICPPARSAARAERNRRAAGADQVAEGLVGELDGEQETVAADPSATLGERPEEEQEPVFGPREV